jgi:hypothetical protein
MHPFSAVTQKGSVCGPMFIYTCFLVLVYGAHQVYSQVSDSSCIHACNTFICTYLKVMCAVKHSMKDIYLKKAVYSQNVVNIHKT